MGPAFLLFDMEMEVTPYTAMKGFNYQQQSGKGNAIYDLKDCDLELMQFKVKLNMKL